MIPENIVGPLISNVVGSLPSLYRGSKADSIVEFSRPARNEFLTLIEDDIVALPYASDITQSMLTLTSCYFLSSLSLLIDIPGLNVLRTLDQINTNRDPIESMLGSGSSLYKFVGAESYRDGLPNPENSLVGLEAATRAGTNVRFEHGSKQELTDKSIKNSNNHDSHDRISNQFINAEDHSSRTTNNVNITEGSGGRGSASGASFGKDTQVTLKELANLSVGKQFEVTFERDGNKQPVQLSVRLMVTNTDSESFKAILRTGSIAQTFKERFIRAKAGQLGWFKDLVLCNDLIDEARRTRIRDKSGFFEHMMRKRSKNFLSGLFSMQPSINNASAILIFKRDTAKQIELELGGSLDEFAIRQRAFETTSAMLMCVVDTQWDTVTIYHRGIDRFNELRVSELKRANKDAGNNVEDILRAYSAFTAPNL